MTLLRAANLALGKRLRPTTFELEAGTLVALVGPNGSGKTSLLHALAGIGSPMGGVRIDDADPWSLPPPVRQRLFSYLPASRDIKWPLLVSDLIRLGLPGDVHICEVVEELELEPFLERRVDCLSTGERGRVLIARALAAEPKLLLLDEPMANLDPLWQLKLMDVVQRRTQRGQSAIVAMHDLDATRRFADRLIVMWDGRIEADGEPENLLSGSVVPEVFGIRPTDEGWIPA